MQKVCFLRHYFFLFFLSLCLSLLFLGCCPRDNQKGCTGRPSWCISPKSPPKIALCCVATGGYDRFALEMFASAQEFFLKGYPVTFFLFTDRTDLTSKDNLKVIWTPHLGWPDATLKRFHVYNEHRALMQEMDYIFAIDADMRFVSNIGDEILGKSVAVARDVGKHVTYESNRKSTAYVSRKQGKHYFAGAFYGGHRRFFLRLMKKMIRNIAKDASWGHVALWHDESHLNHYLFRHPPKVCLDSGYCYFEGWDLPYNPKVIALDKKKRAFVTSEVR